MKVVIGGQINKKEIEALIKEFDSSLDTSIKSDIDAAMDLKKGTADYYLGACHTGGGGALAMTMAIVGRDLCETVSMPGKAPNEEKIKEAVKKGKKAFGFTGDHMDKAVPMIIDSIKKYRDGDL